MDFQGSILLGFQHARFGQTGLRCRQASLSQCQAHLRRQAQLQSLAHNSRQLCCTTRVCKELGLATAAHGVLRIRVFQAAPKPGNFGQACGECKHAQMQTKTPFKPSKTIGLRRKPYF